MTPEQMVAKYLKTIQDIRSKTNNRVTHAWIEGQASSELVMDISAAIESAKSDTLEKNKDIREAFKYLYRFACNRGLNWTAVCREDIVSLNDSLGT